MKNNQQKTAYAYVWKAVTDLCAKKIRFTIVFMCSFHLVMRFFHLSYALFLFGYVFFSVRYVIILFGYALFTFGYGLFSFGYVLFSFRNVLFPLFTLFMHFLFRWLMAVMKNSVPYCSYAKPYQILI